MNSHSFWCVLKLKSLFHTKKKVLAKSKKPIIILGSASLQRSDSAALFSLVSKLAHQVRSQSGCSEDWRVLNILHRVSKK